MPSLHRPRILYCALFTWNAITGGRFVAPFLSHEASFTDTTVGLTLATQFGVVAILGGWGGALADSAERRVRNGRIKVLCGGVALGTVAFLGHGLGRVWDVVRPPESSTDHYSIAGIPAYVIWHLAMRLVYAVAMALTAPVMDGLTLAHLEREEGTTQLDYGKERLHGAIWWGIANVAAGPCIDRWGFGCLYVLAVVTAVVWYVTVGVYVMGLSGGPTDDIKAVVGAKDTDDGASRTTNGDAEEKSEKKANNVSFHADVEIMGDATGTERRTGKSGFVRVPTKAKADADAEGDRSRVLDSPSRRRLYARGSSLIGSMMSKGRRSRPGSSLVSPEGSRISIDSIQEAKETSDPKEDGEGKGEVSMWFLLRLMCGTTYGAAFLFAFFTFATGFAVVEYLVFLFFEFLGSSNTMSGLTVAFTVLMELPVFHVAPVLLVRFGPGLMQQAACAAYVLRVTGYMLVPKGRMWIVLCLETLHGVSYACSQAGAVEFVARVMPEGYEASGQGLLTLFRFLGAVVGLSAGGWAEEVFGPRIMYGGMASTVLLGMVVFGFAGGCSWPDGEPSNPSDQDDQGVPQEKECLCDKDTRITNSVMYDAIS